MIVADEIHEGTFIRRKSRFSCLVEVSHNQEVVYLPNSGRLETVLVPGHKVFLAQKASPDRQTAYDLVGAASGGGFVSVDSRVPATLIHQALSRQSLPAFSTYCTIRREVPRGRSRLDFMLIGPASECFIEVKSVTLVRDGRALFPDAPTDRGRRHVESLTWARREGYVAAIVFVIQRADAEEFAPNDAVDPLFGLALREAHSRGVHIYAYRCKVTPAEIELGDEVPVRL